MLIVMRYRLCLAAMVLLCGGRSAIADIFVTGFFSGKIERFDEETLERTVYATIGSNPGLSGIAYNPLNHRVYVSALNQGGVYELDATDGGIINFHLLGYGPGGLTVSAGGKLAITDFTSNLVRFYNSSMVPQGSIAVPAATVTSGVGYLASGDLIISTAGGGVFRYDGTTVTAFTSNPVAQLAASQVAADSDGNIFIGHGIGFSDNAFRFTSTGTLTGVITVTDTMLDGTGTGSSIGTSPSGVAIDSSGHVIVAALGRSNPGDPGGERGGLLKFDTNGNLLETFIAGSSAYSSVAIFNPVIEAEIENAFVLHNTWTGQGEAIDSETIVHREAAQPETLTIDNLINTSAGLNGLGFDIVNLANGSGLNESDFEFQMSPQGVFDLQASPPVAWMAAPPPNSITVSQQDTQRVFLVWLDNQIENRWLRVTVKSTGNTGLRQPVTYYIGHLRGETTGVENNIYTVSFADVNPIRAAVGSTVGAGSKTDIDKNGTVSFSDITSMRSGIGKQLSNITVPVFPPSE
jgi:sugar lactone lactonase YvrE